MGKVLAVAITNVVLVIGVAPLYEGVIRKLKALVHSRQGPPLVQPYLDLFKLLGKEDLRVGGNPLQAIAPILTFGSVLMVALLTPMGTEAPLAFGGDLIILIYFLTLASVGIMLGGSSTGSVYGAIGMGREMMLAMVAEIIIIGSLIVGVIHSRSFNLADISAWYRESGPCLSMIIAAVPFFLTLQVQLGKLPFDIPDADQEIMGGPFMEASGPKFALYKWSYFAKQVILVSLFWEIFIPWPKSGIVPVDIVINLIKVFIAIVMVGLVDAVCPRIRVDQAIRYFFGLWVVLIFGIAFALIGV